MATIDWIVLSLILAIVVPIFIYQCIKFGTAGFYRGKEAGKRRIDARTMNDKKRKFKTN